jgi:hypothetical protein
MLVDKGLASRTAALPIATEWKPPVPSSHQLHGGREQQHPNDRRIDEDCKAKTDAERFDELKLAGAECGKDDQHNKSRGRDHAR